MADKKISALTAAATPLAGTEVLPIVQSGSTVKVSVDNLTYGKTVTVQSLKLEKVGTFAGSGFLNANQFVSLAVNNGSVDQFYINQSASQGALEITSDSNLKVLSGKGIDFSANTHAAGMTSELLNDYEEGVISIGATCDSGTITLSSNTLYYTKIGRMVHVTGSIVVGSVSSPTGNVYFGLPIAAGISTAVTLYMSNTNTIVGKIPVGVINAGQSIFYIQTLDQTTGNIGGAASIFKAGTEFTFSASYI